MIEFIVQHWDTFVIGVLCFAAGNHLGQKIGFNDGLFRAGEIMQERMTTRQSPLGDKPKV
jgi:hypothetical protein